MPGDIFDGKGEICKKVFGRRLPESSSYLMRNKKWEKNLHPRRAKEALRTTLVTYFMCNWENSSSVSNSIVNK